MKKISAILLLMLLLFNLYGYRLWFYYLQQQSQQKMAEVIDKNTYNDSDLITVKIPLSLPYSTSWNDFEDYEGNIEMDGQHYNYVKRKLQNDTLVLLCLPNKQQNKLIGNRKNFEKLINDSHSTGSNKTNSALLLVKLMGEYYNNTALYQFSIPVIALPNCMAFHNFFYYHYSIGSPWQPPDFLV